MECQQGFERGSYKNHLVNATSGCQDPVLITGDQILYQGHDVCEMCLFLWMVLRIFLWTWKKHEKNQGFF